MTQTQGWARNRGSGDRLVEFSPRSPGDFGARIYHCRILAPKSRGLRGENLPWGVGGAGFLGENFPLESGGAGFLGENFPWDAGGAGFLAEESGLTSTQGKILAEESSISQRKILAEESSPTSIPWEILAEESIILPKLIQNRNGQKLIRHHPKSKDHNLTKNPSKLQMPKFNAKSAQNRTSQRLTKNMPKSQWPQFGQKSTIIK